MQPALDTWGLNAQVDQTTEECAELIVALHKHTKRIPHGDTYTNVLDELADVEMMLAQMRLALGISDPVFQEYLHKKFIKLEQYLFDYTA